MLHNLLEIMQNYRILYKFLKNNTLLNLLGMKIIGKNTIKSFYYRNII
jgi:hypothetical protein